MSKKRKKIKKGNFGKTLLTGAKAVFSFSWRALPSVLVAAAGIGVFFGVRQALYADPQLSVHEVIVDPAASISNAKRQDLEGRLLGKNILKIDLEKIARDLQKNPSIQSAHVERMMPSSLRIGIQTRTPVAFIRFSPSGKFGLISSDGMILEAVDAKNDSLPLIEAYGLDRKQPEAGAQLKDRGFQETVRFLKAYWEDPVSTREPLSRVSLDPQGNVSITLGPGPDIRLGRHPSTRLAVLEKMMYLIQGENRKNLEYVDLQFDNVIVKRKK